MLQRRTPSHIVSPTSLRSRDFGSLSLLSFTSLLSHATPLDHLATLGRREADTSATPDVRDEARERGDVPTDRVDGGDLEATLDTGIEEAVVVAAPEVGTHEAGDVRTEVGHAHDVRRRAVLVRPGPGGQGEVGLDRTFEAHVSGAVEHEAHVDADQSMARREAVPVGTATETKREERRSLGGAELATELHDRVAVGRGGQVELVVRARQRDACLTFDADHQVRASVRLVVRLAGLGLLRSLGIGARVRERDGHDATAVLDGGSAADRRLGLVPGSIDVLNRRRPHGSLQPDTKLRPGDTLVRLLGSGAHVRHGDAHRRFRREHLEALGGADVRRAARADGEVHRVLGLTLFVPAGDHRAAGVARLRTCDRNEVRPALLVGHLVIVLHAGAAVVLRVARGRHEVDEAVAVVVDAVGTLGLGLRGNAGEDGDARVAIVIRRVRVEVHVPGRASASADGSHGGASRPTSRESTFQTVVETDLVVVVDVAAAPGDVVAAAGDVGAGPDDLADVAEIVGHAAAAHRAVDVAEHVGLRLPGVEHGPPVGEDLAHAVVRGVDGVVGRGEAGDEGEEGGDEDEDRGDPAVLGHGGTSFRSEG